MPTERLLDAIRQVYGTATDASRWPACLTSIGALVLGTSANLLYHDHRSQGGIQIAIGADPELYRLYSEYGHAIDPWALACRPGAIPAGRVLIGASIVDPARMRKTEFYAAMGRRYEASRALFGVLEASSHQSAVLALNRGDRHEEFDSHDARLLSLLVPHVRRALAIHRRLGGLDADRAHLLDALDRLPRGLVLVDDRARPIFVNRYAARLLEQRDGLSIEKEALIAAAPEAALQLARALGSAIAITRGRALTMESGDFLIPRSTRRPLFASVSPAGGGRPDPQLIPRVAASLFLVDPDALARPLNDRLRELFSLTTAEARVADAVAAGRDVAAIADEFRVSRETVRSHVKRVLEKAGVGSQSAFMRLVATESIRLLGLQSDR
jgi:DNA-binding CsgD family transcriptional regulator